MVVVNVILTLGPLLKMNSVKPAIENCTFDNTSQQTVFASPMGYTALPHYIAAYRSWTRCFAAFFSFQQCFAFLLAVDLVRQSLSCCVLRLHVQSVTFT